MLYRIILFRKYFHIVHALYIGKIMYCLNVLLKWIAEWVAWHSMVLYSYAAAAAAPTTIISPAAATATSAAALALAPANIQ